MKQPARRLLPLSLTGAVVAADQISKSIAAALLPYGRPVPVIGELLRLTYISNPAIAFSIGGGMSGLARTVLALVFPLLVMALLAGYYFYGREIRPVQRWLIAAVLGGGVGNYLDRLLRPGGVVDFIDVKFYGVFGLDRWPTFNLADSTVVVAGLLLLITYLRGPEKGKRR